MPVSEAPVYSGSEHSVIHAEIGRELTATLTEAQQALVADLEMAERKAWDSLSRYKFMQFGYWAAIWVHLNRVGRFHRPSPFARLVSEAQKVLGQ